VSEGKGAEVFVVVLNWNGRDVIEACLESLRKVKEPAIEVLVVDNASTDGSNELVRSMYPDVELIENESNLMFAEGNNVGIRRALERGARYILLLNNDTEVESDFLAFMLEAIERESTVGVVGPKILYYDTPGKIWYGGGSFYPLLWVPRHLNIRKTDGTFEDVGGETGYVSGCAMLVRRETFEDVGLLDPSYFIYCEDVDFCLRARRKGWLCLYEPRARVYHKVSSSSGGGLTPFKLENRIYSTFLLHKRYRPMWWRVLLFPVHLVSYLLMVVLLFITGKWKLLAGAFNGLRRVLRGR